MRITREILKEIEAALDGPECLINIAPWDGILLCKELRRAWETIAKYADEDNYRTVQGREINGKKQIKTLIEWDSGKIARNYMEEIEDKND